MYLLKFYNFYYFNQFYRMFWSFLGLNLCISRFCHKVAAAVRNNRLVRHVCMKDRFYRRSKSWFFFSRCNRSSPIFELYKFISTKWMQLLHVRGCEELYRNLYVRYKHARISSAQLSWAELDETHAAVLYRHVLRTAHSLWPDSVVCHLVFRQCHLLKHKQAEGSGLVARIHGDISCH